MDDFERELTRMMREGRTHIPLEPGQRTRLYDGIRARRRSRALVRAGGSALAVAGLSIGLALLPHLGSDSAPADLPLPATGSTAPGASEEPTMSPSGTGPSPSLPPTHTPESMTAATSPPRTTEPGTTEPGTADPDSTHLGTRERGSTGTGTAGPGPDRTPTSPPPTG
ncbi:cellulase [Streptomyces sp. Vc74B-19]|uniref:cellulase n=1 Tax=unclassified Streptomyces TaxID=2593676 RepID=UPI001BFC42FA|nr:MULTISPECIES: cellulase [unclassified Streptomyces]MBT3164203.1 cellulase [Streptomyces sp. Vc74B-19]MDU0305148.1 cellulase [Streptomyces sp. PAL114]